MWGLIAKALRETWWMTLLLAIAMAAVMGQLTYILPQVQRGLGGIFKSLPFVQTIMSAMMGTEIGETITAQMMQAMLWVHPVVLSLLWGFEIVMCTRFPAGEIDRGTIDLLLGLPVSRRQVFWAESLVWLLSGILILASGLLGHVTIVRTALPLEARPDLAKSLLIMANLLCVYLAVGGVALLSSAYGDRRGIAMAAVFALLLFSYLLNFLAQFWDPAKNLVFLSVMHYYQPARIFQAGLDASHVAILLAIAGVSWGWAGEVVARRDIHTI